MGSLRVHMTERLHFHLSLSCIGEGNGNPLQCSCLENPRDGGAWWAAVYAVAQSQTGLKQLSSSSSLLYFFFAFNFYHFVYYGSQNVLPWVYPAGTLHYLGLGDCFLSHVREVFIYYVFKYFLRSILFLFSFWDPYNAKVSYI